LSTNSHTENARFGESRNAALVEEHRGVVLSRSAVVFHQRDYQSHVRPDQEATRRNGYQRLLGMDLNHGAADNKPYSYVRAEASNKEFVSTFEELLREVWIGIINAGQHQRSQGDR
jgi:hypothetical protein